MEATLIFTYLMLCHLRLVHYCSQTDLFGCIVTNFGGNHSKGWGVVGEESGT